MNCDHEYEVYERKDANIEPELNNHGSYSTITEYERCKKCGHELTRLNPN